VIAHSLYSVRVSLNLATRFMLRRSIRLDPPYWIAIAVAIGFAALSSLIVPGKPRLEISGAQILAHVFYLQDILKYPSFNSVFWTLCLEVQFYLLYVAALALGRNKPDLPYQGWIVPLILLAAMMVSLLWPTQMVTGVVWSGSFLPLWHGFLVGVLAYWSWRNHALAPFFLVTIAILILFTNGNPFSIACATTAATLWIAALTGSISRALNWRWLQFLGMISYSLYLIHNPITGASFRVGYMLTGHQLWWEFFWWLASVLACILFASVMWALVERPSINIARRLKLRPVVST
jgi:peptidoglycan/LPS O-acetylase OafA/YrhL